MLNVVTPLLSKQGLRDLKGLKFGFLLVLQRVTGKVSGKIRWRCLCDCGTRITVRHDYLLNTNSPKRHCGCKTRREPSLKSQHVQEYHIWKMMLVRCNNPKHGSYKQYGARGIKVCAEWTDSFEQFLADLGPRPSPNHSLDRKNADGHYEPGNVQWATAKHQARNKRKSLFLPHPQTGEKVPAAEVAEFLGITYQQLRYQYQKKGLWPTW